jgi:hypothetical protein
MQKTQNVSHLEGLMADFNLTPKELGAALRVSPTAVNHWLRGREAPAWTIVAVEGLRRRRRACDQKRRTFLLQIPQEHVETFVAIMNSIGGRVSEIQNFLED